MKKILFVIPLLAIVFSACSTKEVYKPKVVSGKWDKYTPLESKIIDRSSNVALLENGKVLTKEGVINIKVDKNQRIISKSNGWILSATIDGNLTMVSENNSSIKKEFTLKKTIASGSVQDDMLAVLFADDEMALYDMQSKGLLFKEQGGKSIASDMRIVNPYFMHGLVIFSTLDGKVVIVNTKLKKRLRTVIVSSDEYFNNIINFKIVDNKIIAVTDSKMLSLTKKELRKKYEIRNIAYDDKIIYITTKQGQIIALTPDLQVEKKIKFPFAHFLGLISSGDKLYALEKEGYMIIVNKKTFDYTVQKADVHEGFVFTAGKVFYVNDEKIPVE